MTAPNTDDELGHVWVDWSGMDRRGYPTTEFGITRYSQVPIRRDSSQAFLNSNAEFDDHRWHMAWLGRRDVILTDITWEPLTVRPADWIPVERCAACGGDLGGSMIGSNLCPTCTTVARKAYDEVSTTAKIAGALEQAVSIAWEGCHKIYLNLDQQQHDVMRQYGYEPLILVEQTPQGRERALQTLAEWWDDSCSLRFIQSVRSVDGDPNDGFTSLIGQFEQWEA